MQKRRAALQQKCIFDKTDMISSVRQADLQDHSDINGNQWQHYTCKYTLLSLLFYPKFHFSITLGISCDIKAQLQPKYSINQTLVVGWPHMEMTQMNRQ